MIKFITIFFLNFFDFIHKKKLVNFLNNKKINLEYIIDVGAHHGETIDLLLKYFKPKKIYSFEASPHNFLFLKKKINRFNEKIKKIIIIENIALGKNSELKAFNQTYESSSSTFSKINNKSNYYFRKRFFLGLKKKDKFSEIINLKIISLDSYFEKNNLQNIDLLKIDTEGFEYEILQGLKKNINKVQYILFEHHYDDMITKKYKFRDINNYLRKKNFNLIFKAKMPFRKSFEYIYTKKEI